MRAPEPHHVGVADDIARASNATVFLRLPAVIRRTGLARSTIYRMVAQDSFPSPVRIAKRAVGWRLSDIERWSAARPTTH